MRQPAEPRCACPAPQVWAEELLEAQHRRRLECEQLRWTWALCPCGSSASCCGCRSPRPALPCACLCRVRLQFERARQEEEERREERRRARWGRSSHHHYFGCVGRRGWARAASSACQRRGRHAADPPSYRSCVVPPQAAGATVCGRGAGRRAGRPPGLLQRARAGGGEGQGACDSRGHQARVPPRRAALAPGQAGARGSGSRGGTGGWGLISGSLPCWPCWPCHRHPAKTPLHTPTLSCAGGVGRAWQGRCARQVPAYPRRL